MFKRACPLLGRHPSAFDVVGGRRGGALHQRIAVMTGGLAPGGFAGDNLAGSQLKV
jgi:hypothetical protein